MEANVEASESISQSIQWMGLKVAGPKKVARPITPQSLQCAFEAFSDSWWFFCHQGKQHTVCRISRLFEIQCHAMESSVGMRIRAFVCYISAPGNHIDEYQVLYG
jgi:hypothetical protein